MYCSDHLNSPFEISEVPKTLVLHTLNVDRGAGALVRPAPQEGRQVSDQENNMISKITAILAAALVLGSAGAASAQTHRHAGAQWQAPYANSYYNQDTRNLRYGHANDAQFDPLAGMVFDGVAPY
jgi:hypothetical protein